jgi:hypothetical protein
MSSKGIRDRLQARSVARARRARRFLRTVFVGACVLLATVVLAACDKEAISASGACGIFQPIRASKADTTATIVQVKGHNAAGKAACGWSRSS